MAVRLTWTNNSSGHDGTYVYRSTSPMDPQALPAPIADLPAGSEEYVDGETSAYTYYYRVQDHEGGQLSAVSDPVQIVDGIIHAGDGDWASTTSGTLISTSAPAGVQVGDLLIAAVMHREALTPPSGWDLVVAAGPTAGAAPQTTALYSRVATSADVGASYDWAQASDNRMQAQVSAFRANQDLVVVDTASLTGVPASATNQFPLADIASQASGQIVVSACSVELHSGSGGSLAESQITPTDDWAGITPFTDSLPAVEARRLCAGWLRADAPQTHGGYLERAPNASLNPDQSHYASAAIIIGVAS